MSRSASTGSRAISRPGRRSLGTTISWFAFTSTWPAPWKTTAELTGMCILITDQTLTPFQVGLRVAATADGIEWVHCRLGERADGGLLRVPYASTRWRKRLHVLNTSTVEWVYDVEVPAATEE
jgi:hypothetical protein